MKISADGGALVANNSGTFGFTKIAPFLKKTVRPYGNFS